MDESGDRQKGEAEEKMVVLPGHTIQQLYGLFGLNEEAEFDIFKLVAATRDLLHRVVLGHVLAGENGLPVNKLVLTFPRRFTVTHDFEFGTYGRRTFEILEPMSGNVTQMYEKVILPDGWTLSQGRSINRIRWQVDKVIFGSYLDDISSCYTDGEFRNLRQSTDFSRNDKAPHTCVDLHITEHSGNQYRRVDDIRHDEHGRIVGCTNSIPDPDKAPGYLLKTAWGYQYHDDGVTAVQGWSETGDAICYLEYAPDSTNPENGVVVTMFGPDAREVEDEVTMLFDANGNPIQISSEKHADRSPIDLNWQY